MKKLLILSLVLLLCASASATKISSDADTRTAILEGVENANQLGTGEVFYVDSNVDGTAGTEWGSAVGTLDEAVNLCTADRGDFIYVAQGHNEGLSAADGVDVDIAGVTIIGFGNGSLKPTLDYDQSAGEFVIGAANVRIKNLRFRTSSGAVTTAIDIEAAGDNAQIVNCEFGYAETSTDEFATAISIETTADDTLIHGCTFRAGAQAAVQAIHIVSDAVGTIITDNLIMGDYSVACIKGTGGAQTDDIVIKNNILYNGEMSSASGLNTQPVIELGEASGGLIVNNFLACELSAAAATVADDMIFLDNVIAADDGDEFDGGARNVANTVSAGGTIDG